MSKECGYSEWLPDFITGNLSEKDCIEITEHVKTCKQCQTDMQFWKALSSEINEINQQVQPPSVLLDRVMSSIRTPGDIASNIRHAFLLIQTQAKFIRHEIWLTSLLIMALGIIAGLISKHNEIMRILIPFVSAMCLAIIYTPDADPSFELILASPNSPRQILLARMVLTYGFNLLLAFFANICLIDLIPGGLLGQVILGWMGPMMFLSALTLVLSLYFGFEIAIFASYSIWLLQFATEFIFDNMQEVFTQQILNLISAFNQMWDEPYLLLMLSAVLTIFAVIQVNNKTIKLDRKTLNI